MMYARSRFATLLSLMALVVFAPTAGFGQDAEPAQAETDTFSGPAMMSDQQIAAMDAAERSRVVASAIADMQGVLQRALEVLEQARTEERDVLKLKCINEKVSAIKGFLKVAEQAQHELGSAIAAADEKEQRHQILLVMLASSRVQGLGEETESCAGKIVQFSGDYTLDVEVDENVRTDNPSAVDTSDVSVDPLPEVSPYQ